MSEKAVRIAGTLYECRDAMRNILGEARYRERARDWVTMINLVMHRHGCDVLQATMKIAEDVAKQGGGTMMLFATAVEMIEGIYALPPLGTAIRYRTYHPTDASKCAEGTAVVEKYLTAETAPAPHMRPRERMLYVCECAGGPNHGRRFLIKASEVIRDDG